jgi:hypothetical protein
MTKHTPATPLTPMQQFYGTPTPSNAIKLALADSFAYCAPMQPDSEYVKALRKALERSDAYPKLVEKSRALYDSLQGRLNTLIHHTATPHEKAAYRKAREEFRALLRELGEDA